MSDPNDSNRTVLITGATGGIGSATARRFAENGWGVLCHTLPAEAADELQAELRQAGATCEILQADFADPAQVQQFLDDLQAYTIDSLINNAGGYQAPAPLGELNLDALAATFQVNLAVPILLAGRLFEVMKQRGFGRIVNISSIAAKYGSGAGSIAYGCSKRGIEALTKTLAREGAADNVLVNTIRPGVIDTNFHKKYPKDMAARIDLIPAKRMGRPEDVARWIYALGSEENQYVTNEIMTVAGGE